MSSKQPLQPVDPKPIPSPPDDHDTISYSVPAKLAQSPEILPRHAPPSAPAPGDTDRARPHPHPPPTTQPYPPGSGLAALTKPADSVPNHPGIAHETPRPPPPQTFTTQDALAAPTRDLRSARATCAHNLGEYIALQRGRRGTMAGDAETDRQRALAARDLRVLSSELRAVAKRGREDRWRRLVLGGALSSLIPLVRRLFRRDPRARDPTTAGTSNDTEYAFVRSASLLGRIRDSLTTGKGGWLAGIAVFVFSVLHVFQNEVEIRVARTVGRRIRKLRERVERGGPDDVRDEDLGVLEGWRWRIIL